MFTALLYIVALAGPGGDTPADRPERAADAGDKIICKRFLRTGSLVDGYRECKSKMDWERERENRRTLAVSDSCRDRANGGFECR